MLIKLSKDLTPLKLEAKAEIDEAAEKIRHLFITPGSGQAMVYQQKLAEAEMVLSGNPYSVSEVPHIAQEANDNNVDIMEQAVVVVSMAHHWRSASALIEFRRLSTKRAVDQAATPAEIETAKMIDWSDIEALAVLFDG